MTRLFTLIAFGPIMFTASVAFAQAPVKFEVASIKPHPDPITFSADPAVRGTRVTATASTLLDLITSAYGLRYDQISGGPNWINSNHYDVAAKAEGDGALTMEQVRPMLQALLEERFRLQVHREIRDVPAFALVVGKNGPKLQRVPADAERGEGGIRVADSVMRMVESKGTMEGLARRLSGNGAGRPVEDKTGLTGYYAYRLEWSSGMPGADSDFPSLLVAIQEQLGLKLESTKGPGEVLVVDHAEKPSEN